MTDRLAAAGWQPVWGAISAVHQPTVAVEVFGRVWGWDRDEWEALCAMLREADQVAAGKEARRLHLPPMAKRGPSTGKEPGLFGDVG